MRTIPQIRERLHEKAIEHGDPELAELAEQTRRRAPCRQTPTARKGLDETLAERIRAYAEAHPTTSQHDIANVFGTNSGRVSEALAGYREDA